MELETLRKLYKHSPVERFSKGEVFYSLDFAGKLYMLRKGYVKRYQVIEGDRRVIESIYGEGYLFPLTQIYKQLFQFDLSQENLTYVYEAMSNVEIQGLPTDEIKAALKTDPNIYRELFFEAGRRLKANITRLASNAINDDYMKVAHQLACLTEEFGRLEQRGGKVGYLVPLPLKPIDMAEQLNLSPELADAIMTRFVSQKLMLIDKKSLFIPDLNIIKDIYLRPGAAINVV